MFNEGKFEIYINKITSKLFILDEQLITYARM